MFQTTGVVGATILGAPKTGSEHNVTRYITFGETQAKLGGRGRTTIYRDIDHGRIPRPVKIGGRLYWEEAALDAAIAALASK